MSEMNVFLQKAIEAGREIEEYRRDRIIHDPNTRSYVVGLPVIIHVNDDGTVIYEIDTSEASSAMKDDWVTNGQEPTMPDQLAADMMRVDMDHDKRHNNNPTI